MRAVLSLSKALVSVPMSSARQLMALSGQRPPVLGAACHQTHQGL